MTEEKTQTKSTDSKIQPPKVFISYSWSSPEHQKRILEWSEQLVHDGVDVILDKWHLKEGQDKYVFMEKMVTDPEVVKVLIFSDKIYAEKSDARKGGVGTESQIISQEVYEKVTQEKFLPIVCEMDQEDRAYLPVFLKSRIYFDFSSPEALFENYEKLLRSIFNKPLYIRPAIGKPPEYITDSNKPYRWSQPLLHSFKDAILQDKSTYRGHASAFLDGFADRLEEFRIIPTADKEYDDQVISSIERFLPFRDDLIEFFNLVVTYKNEPALYEQIGDFFEKCLRYQYPPSGTTSWNEMWPDNFRFFQYELFLYLIGLLIKKQKFSEARIFFDRVYYLPEEARSSHNRIARFDIFRPHCASLENVRKRRLKSNRLSIVADLIKERATQKNLTFADLMQAECVLLVESMINAAATHPWFAVTMIYAHYSSTFEIFARAASKKEFVKLKSLFSISTKDEFVHKLRSALETHKINTWDIFWHAHIDIAHLLGLQELGTLA